MVAGDMEIHLYVVPVPGNHEVQCPPGAKLLCPRTRMRGAITWAT